MLGAVVSAVTGASGGDGRVSPAQSGTGSGASAFSRGALTSAMDGDGRASPAQSVFSARTGDSTSYAMETLTQEKRDALIDLIVYNEMKGNMRDLRALVRSLNTCQRAEAVLLLVELASTTLDEIAEGRTPKGSADGRRQMECLQEIQELRLRLQEMSTKCAEQDTLRLEAQNAALEARMQSEEADMLRQEAEFAAIEMRAQCERMMATGAEQEKRIALLQEEIASMRKEREESAARGVNDSAESLNRELSDLQGEVAGLKLQLAQQESAACGVNDTAEGTEGLSELQRELEQACLRVREADSLRLSLQEEVETLKSQLAQKESDIKMMSERVAGGVGNSPLARERKEKQQEDEGMASRAERAAAKARTSIAEFTARICESVDTIVLNPADARRAAENWEALIELQKSSAGDGGDALGGKRLALIEVDDAAMEALLGKIRTTAGEKTGKAFEFSTEEALLRHILGILEAATPSREVLLGSLLEKTIVDAMFTLDSRYKYVKDEITNTAAAAKLSFEARLSRMKLQDQKILMTVAEIAFSKVSATYAARCALRPKEAVQGQRVLQEARSTPQAGWMYVIAASECVVKTTWKNLANAFEDLLQYMKYMEEACNGSIKKIGEQWEESIAKFERSYGPITTQTIRTLGKLHVLANPSTAYIKADKSHLQVMREYDEGMTDFQSAAAHIEEIWRKLEVRELSGAEGQKSLHTKPTLNWKNLRKEALRKESAVKDRDTKHAVKIDYTVALALGEREGYTVLFAGDIPKSDTNACRSCGKYHKPNVNCGPTLEAKLKAKDEVEKLAACVSTMAKIFEKDPTARTKDEDKRLVEFIQRTKDLADRLRAPSDKTHDGRHKRPQKHSNDCYSWVNTGRCAEKDKGCRFAHDPAKKGVQSSKGAAKQGQGRDDEGSAPECALPKCKELCLWDPKGNKYWKYCCPDHAMAAKGGDTACPAFVINIVDASISAEEIVAGTTTYITPLVPRAAEDLEAKAAALARSIIGDDELLHFDISDPDDVEEMGKIMLIAAFEQVSGRDVSEKDRTNIEDVWQPGMLCASTVAEIYTGKQAQEIANLYNALAQEMRTRCVRVQKEIASQIEGDELLQNEATRLGQDLATKIEVARIIAQQEMESMAYGVVLEVVDLALSQVVPSVQKSRNVEARVKTANEEAWDALKAKRESKKKAADAHAAMLVAHSQARADKLRARKERAMGRGIVSSVIDELVTSVSSTSFHVHEYVEDFVLDLMTDSCIVACAIGNDDVSVQGQDKHDDQPEMQGRTVDEALDRRGHPRGRIPGRKAPDAAGVRRETQDYFVYTIPGPYGAWRRMPRRLYRRHMHDFLRARMKRSARKHLTMTRYSPTVQWDASSGDDPPPWDRAGALNEEEVMEWRSLHPMDGARPRKRSRIDNTGLVPLGDRTLSGGAQEERTKPGELHSQMHRVVVRSYWCAPHIFSSYMSLSSVVTRHLHFDAETQEYINMPASEAIEFLASYNVRLSEVMPGLILLLYDTGCTVLLSPLSDHFCVEITCDAAINGIGRRSVSISGPVAISFLDAKAQNYVTYESPRGFFMGDLNFGIFPSGQAERKGWEFHVRELNPYFIADGLHVPLIKDYQTGLTWMAERKFAKPTVAAKRRFVETFAKDSAARIFRDRIGEPEICPKAPDTKENIDRYITQAGSSCFGQYHCTSRPTVVRGGSHATTEGALVGTRSQSAKKNDAQNNGKQDRGVGSGVALHDQSEREAGEHERQEPVEQITNGNDDREAGNQDLQLVTESGFQDLEMQIAKPPAKSDEEMLTKAKIVAASKMKPRYVKVPAARFFNLGADEETAAWHRYYHQLAVHLEPGTVWEGVKLADGAEVLKGLELLRRVEGKHATTCACDECLRYKSKLSPIPDRRTDRPRRIGRVKKLFLDPSGKLNTPSIYHNYQYYVLGVTDEGYMIVEGMTFRDQVLFVVGRMFDSLGGAPISVQVDPAGELNSKIAESYFTHRETRVDVTQSSEHWRNGRPERRHSLVKGCTRCTLAHANAPLEFWYLCLSHVVFTLNLLLRSRDNDTKEIKDMTVWEAHFGRKPNLNHYLIGPWGCLAYIVLTKEQRDKRGMDKSWGPRALAGIYVGCVMNHKEGAYEFLVHDGMRIRSTTANLRIVGDCFPFKYQQRRDLDLVISPQVEELEDDDVDLIANVGSVDEERGHCSALSCRGVENLLDEASQEYVRELQRIFVFVGSENKEAQVSLKRRVLKSKEKGRALLKSKQRVHNAIARNSVAESRDPDEYLVEVTESGEQVAILDPRDFHLPAAPNDFKFILPYEGAKYRIAEPVDFSTKREMSVTARNPHERYIGRKVRKAFRIRRKVRGKATTVWQPFEGVVRSYDAKRAVFDILYEDSDEEEVDFLELGEILIMGKEFGDKEEHKGLTRAEVTARMGEEALIAAVAEEAMASHGRTSYGEDRPRRRVTFEEKEHPCAHVDAKNSCLACDCGLCMSGSANGTMSGSRMWKAQYDTKGDLALDLKRWRYGKSGTETCGWMADEAEENEFGSVQCVARCRCDTCRFCYVCQGDEVVWSNEKARFCLEENVKFGQGELEHTKDQLEKMLRQRKVATANARCFAATTAVASGEEAQGLEDSVSTPASAGMETKIDDAPRNAKELHAHEEYEAIVKSGKLEIKQLLDMGVFVLPSDQEMKEIKEQNKRVLRCKMVYARKYESVVGADGQIRDRFLKWKGRLAAVGTGEVKSLDTCWSTFSPTIGMTALRTLIALMCRKGFDVRSYDLSGAFLGTDLAREVYVKLPEEAGKYAGKVVRCVKALYGLITSSRDFVNSLSERILSFEDNGGKFKKMDTDHCIYIFMDKDGNEIILSHYVDDIICGSNNPALRARLFEHLNLQWKITDEGVLTRFVGLNFERSDNGLTWEASCGPYIDKIAKRFKVDPKVQETPMDAGFAVMPEDLREEHSAEEMAAMETEFRSMIGSLAFASVTIRWDIAYSVSVLSRYLMKPNRKVIAAARRVIQYLMSNRDMKIRWTAEEDSVPADKRNKLWGAADASYASDVITRRSHGGYMLFLNGGCVSWKSGLQKMVTLSSCESEFVALCSAILEVRYLRQFLNELGHRQEEPTLLWEDNKAAIIVAEGETSSAGRSKHIDVRFKHVAQSIREGVARVRYVSTKWNYADLMTKPLAKLEFKRVRDLCLRPESGVTGYPSMEQDNVPLEDETANFIFEESWLG